MPLMDVVVEAPMNVQNDSGNEELKGNFTVEPRMSGSVGANAALGHVEPKQMETFAILRPLARAAAVAATVRPNTFRLRP